MYDTLLQAWKNTHASFDPGYSIDADLKPFYERLTAHQYLNQAIKVHSFNATAFRPRAARWRRSCSTSQRPRRPRPTGKMPKMWSSSYEKNATVHPLQYEMLSGGRSRHRRCRSPARRWRSTTSSIARRSAASAATCTPASRAGGCLEKFAYTAPLRSTTLR
jgi:hypothetical protein